MPSLAELDKQDAMLRDVLGKQGIKIPGMAGAAAPPGESGPAPGGPLGQHANFSGSLPQQWGENIDEVAKRSGFADQPAMMRGQEQARRAALPAGTELSTAPAPPEPPVAQLAEDAAKVGAESPAATSPQQPAYAAPTYVGAHFDDRNIPIKADTRKQILGTYDAMAGADAQLARAQQDEAAIAANAHAAEAERARHSLAERAQVEDQRQQIARQQLAKLDEVTNAAASGRIDENAVMNAKGAGGRFAAAIGIILGGGLVGQGGRNPALDIINDEIARSIDVQKANLHLAQQGVSNQQNLLGHYREVFGDERMAEMAFENSARQVAIQQLQAGVAKAQSPIIAANAQAGIAQIKQAQLKTQAEFEKMSFVHAQMVGGSAPTGAASVQRSLEVKMPDGRTLLAPTEQEGKELRAKVGAASNIQANIDRALLLRSKASVSDLINPYSLVRKQLASLEAESKQLVTVYRDQGAMSKGDADVATDALGSMTGVLSNNDTVLKDTKARFGQGLETIAKSLGGEHVQTGYRVDPKSGRLAPDAVFTGSSDKPPQKAMPKGFTSGLPAKGDK